jgi:hypothetical protein
MGIGRAARRGLSTIRLGRVLQPISLGVCQIYADVLTLFGALKSNVELLPISHVMNNALYVLKARGGHTLRGDELAKTS